MFRRILTSTRYLIGFAILGAFIAALTTLIYGAVTTVKIAVDAFAAAAFIGKAAKGFELIPCTRWRGKWRAGEVWQ